jgi:hypothetical protein
MAETLYCWRCNRNASMLTEQEWTAIHPLLSDMVLEIQQYRKDNSASLAEAIGQNFGKNVLLRYQELTGVSESNPDVLWHHRASLFGPACVSCGKPLRTAQATFCAACGTSRA